MYARKTGSAAFRSSQLIRLENFWASFCFMEALSISPSTVSRLKRSPGTFGVYVPMINLRPSPCQYMPDTNSSHITLAALRASDGISSPCKRFNRSAPCLRRTTISTTVSVPCAEKVLDGSLCAPKNSAFFDRAMRNSSHLRPLLPTIFVGHTKHASPPGLILSRARSRK